MFWSKINNKYNIVQITWVAVPPDPPPPVRASLQASLSWDRVNLGPS